MAEKLSEEDFALLQNHLAKFPDQRSCPICQHRNWNVSGLETAVGYLNGSPTFGAPAMPVVRLVCTTCFFVRDFAWVGIQRAAGRTDV